MNKLIPVINRLQSVFSQFGTCEFDLPQIVVVGEQSSGKSSVLESIVGQPCLPRGTGIVTRCPIVLQLHKINYKHAPETSNGEEASKEWIEFPHLPEGERTITDFNEITDIINREVDERTGPYTGRGRVILSEPIIMKIFSPNVLDLTVVDLPGIVRNAVDGQSEAIIQEINDLVRKYIANENSIILAVSAATNDLATSTSIQYAREVDPDFNRTIAVLTKLDLMDQGTDATDALTGGVIKVKLGVVGVVNRSFDDTQKGKSIQYSLEKEEQFLGKHYPHIADQNGTKYLSLKLSRLLMEHIRKTIVPLQAKLESRKAAAEKDLLVLGEDVPQNKTEVFLRVVEKFSDLFKSEILGTNPDIDTKKLNGRAEMSLIFDEKLPGSLPTINLKDLDIFVAILNARPLESNTLVSEVAFQFLARNQIKLLKDPAFKCAKLIKEEMLAIGNNCVQEMGMELQRFPALAHAIRVEVSHILNQRLGRTIEMLEDYVENQASFIKTYDDEFNGVASFFFRTTGQDPTTDDDFDGDEDASGGDSAGNLGTSMLSRRFASITQGIAGLDITSHGLQLSRSQKSSCDAMRNLVGAYFSIVTKAFLDYCPKVIMRNVVKEVIGSLNAALVQKFLCNGSIDELINEDDSVTGDRRRLKQLLTVLETANAEIREVNRFNI